MAGGKPAPGCTPDQAKEVWDSLKNPTPCAVANALAQVGLYITENTVRKWQRAGWKTKRKFFNPPDKFTHAETSADIAISVLTMDATTRLRDMVPDNLPTGPLGIEDGTRKKLEDMSDLELVRHNVRKAAITMTLINEEIINQRERLVSVLPEELGNLIKAQAIYAEAVSQGYERFVKLQESLMRTINKPDQRDPEIDDPLREAIKNWRAPRPSAQGDVEIKG